MKLEGDNSVFITKEGLTYHRCDDGQWFKSFTFLNGSIFDEQVVELDLFGKTVINVTPGEFMEFVLLMYDALVEQGAEPFKFGGKEEEETR